MTSIKVKFRPGCRAEHPGSIVYMISHLGRSRTVSSGYRLYACEWNDTASAGRSPNQREQYVTEAKESVHHDLEHLRRIIDRLTHSSVPFSADDVAAEFMRFSRLYSLFTYMDRQISTLRGRGKPRTAEIYRTTLNSFRRFRNDNDVRIDCLTPDMLSRYETSMRLNGITCNTSSFYMRVLRAVYNRAAEEAGFDNRHPFRHVYTGIDKTVKRALPIQTISRIRALSLARHPKLDFARDMFMMSFFLRGMSFVDMAFLRKSDLDGGRVTYRRRKTGQQLTVGWTQGNAGHCRQISMQPHPVSAADHHPQGYRRKAGVPQYFVIDQQQSQKTGSTCRFITAAYNVLRPPQLGFGSKNQGGAFEHYQRRHGTQLRNDNPHLPGKP